MPDEASSLLTIDLGAIAANYRMLQQMADPAICGAAVKADAYGLGVGMGRPHCIAWAASISSWRHSMRLWR